MLKFSNKKNRAFTLIELLVVIAVIGLLSSIVLVSLGPARTKARDARRQSDVRQINLAMEMCYDDVSCGPGEGKYPVATIGANAWTKIDSDGTPTFLTMPSDPTNAGDYRYFWYVAAEQYYCLVGKIETGAATTPTYICASNRGVAQKTYAATSSITKDECCGMDLD